MDDGLHRHPPRAQPCIRMATDGLQGFNCKELKDASGLDTLARSWTHSVVTYGFSVLRGASTSERRICCPFISIRHVLRHIQAPEALPSLYGIEEDGVGIGLRWHGARNYARSFLHPNSADVRVVHKVSYNFWFNNTKYDADRHSRTFNINGNYTPRFDRLLRSKVRLFEKVLNQL